MRPASPTTILISDIASHMRKKEILDLCLNPEVSLHHKLTFLEHSYLDMGIQGPNLLNGGLFDKWNDTEIQ